ncbi:MAG: hypothetical protein V1776_03010 [Candidatus Diapherotrites archaeon]
MRKFYPIRKKMNNKGQAFEAYRVLIAMVISLAILTIILSAVTYFDTLREKVSIDTLYSSWKSAVDSPNGKVVLAKDLYFTSQTTFGKRQFALQAGLDEACIGFDAEKAAGFILNDANPDKPVVTLTRGVVGNVYMECQTENFLLEPAPPDCYAYCLISFGKLIAGPI